MSHWLINTTNKLQNNKSCKIQGKHHHNWYGSNYSLSQPVLLTELAPQHETKLHVTDYINPLHNRYFDLLQKSHVGRSDHSIVETYSQTETDEDDMTIFERLTWYQLTKNMISVLAKQSSLHKCHTTSHLDLYDSLFLTAVTKPPQSILSFIPFEDTKLTRPWFR